MTDERLMWENVEDAHEAALRIEWARTIVALAEDRGVEAESSDDETVVDADRLGCEGFLHELAHLTILTNGVLPDCRWGTDPVHALLQGYDARGKDQNEAETVIVELMVANSLELRFDEAMLTTFAAAGAATPLSFTRKIRRTRADLDRMDFLTMCSNEILSQLRALRRAEHVEHVLDIGKRPT